MNGASTIRACLTTTTGFAAVLRRSPSAPRDRRSARRRCGRGCAAAAALAAPAALRRRPLRRRHRRAAASRRPRTPIAARSACSCPERARPSPASGRSPPSCAAGSSRRSSISTATPAIQLADRPATTTIYVSLPPPGSHHNVTRYPVAIVGPGYRGAAHLGVDADRRARLARGHRADCERDRSGRRRRRSARAADRDAAAALARLDVRLTRAHDARTGATLVLVGWLVAFAALGILARRSLAGRAAVLVAPVALATALLLRAVGIDQPSAVIAILAVATGLGSLLLALRPRAPRSCRRRLPGGVPRRARGLAGGQRAGGDRAAPGRRRTVLRRHERGRDAPARAVTRRCGGSRRRRRRGDRAPAPRSRRLEPRRRGRGRTAGRHGCRSPSCSPGSTRVRLTPARLVARRRGSARGRARDRRPRCAARRLEPRHRRGRRRPRHAARRSRPAPPDLVGRSDVGGAHGVPLPPVARRVSRGSASAAGSSRRSPRCSSRSACRCSSTTRPSTCSATARSAASRSRPGRRRVAVEIDARSASALRLRAAFQSHESTPRVDRQVEPDDPGPSGRAGEPSRRRRARGSPRPSSSTATSSSRCGSGRGARPRP